MKQKNANKNPITKSELTEVLENICEHLKAKANRMGSDLNQSMNLIAVQQSSNTDLLSMSLITHAQGSFGKLPEEIQHYIMKLRMFVNEAKDRAGRKIRATVCMNYIAAQLNELTQRILHRSENKKLARNLVEKLEGQAKSLTDTLIEAMRHVAVDGVGQDENGAEWDD